MQVVESSSVDSVHKFTHEQILGRSHTGTKDRSGTKRSDHVGWHGSHLSSNNQEHLGVGDHDDERYHDEVERPKRGHKHCIFSSHEHNHVYPREICLLYTHIIYTADNQTQYPEGRDDRTKDAVSEDGEVGERSNNDGTLDDRDGSKVPKGAHAESVHTAVDQSR